MHCVIVPVGVTRETVESLVKAGGLTPAPCIIAVTVPGYEEAKEEILRGLEMYARLVNARFYSVVIGKWDPYDPARILEILYREKPQRITLIGVTGSRYLYPILFMVLLHYWRETKAEINLLHGVEGEEARIEPLTGYIAPALGLKRKSLEVFKLIYDTTEELSGKKLIEKHGYSRTIYKTLRKLEEKGLIKTHRGKIEKTHPGKTLYNLLKQTEKFKYYNQP